LALPQRDEEGGGYEGMKTTKRKDECQFCTRRACYNQIYRLEIPLYDEVFCSIHIDEAGREADRILGGRGSKIMRTHRSSTGKLRRGSY
jgi:hypothetical protein